jgi:tripartite-type tricarboxylate transporter receptor subunit TctC
MRPLLASAVAAALLHAAHAQETYPSRPITLVAPFAAGGSTDLVARVLSEGLRARLGQPVTVENKAGANGLIGIRDVVKAAPDGHTLLIGSAGSLVTPAVMFRNFPVDAARDLVPVAAAAEWAAVMLARKALPVGSLPEFVAYAKARPGRLNFGTSGYGSLVHLLAEAFMKEAGIAMQHVPYKGGANSMADLLAGTLDVLFTSSPVAVGQAQNRNLLMLAAASKRRLQQLPDVPTMAEGGYPRVDQTSWLGVFAPAGLPPTVRERLSGTVLDIVRDPEAQERLRRIGFEPLVLDHSAFAEFVRLELERWGDFVNARGLAEK